MPWRGNRARQSPKLLGRGTLKGPGAKTRRRSQRVLLLVLQLAQLGHLPGRWTSILLVRVLLQTGTLVRQSLF